jgi:hypothetical protein
VGVRAWVGTFLWSVACGDEHAPQEVELETPPAIEAIPEVRRCGEAGSQPTILPPDVARGMQRVAVCPERALLQHTLRPQFLWLSTEGIREHALDPDADTLVLRLADDERPPVLQIFEHRFGQRVALVPGMRSQVRALDHVVRVEEVIVDDARTDEASAPTVHVRASVEGAPAVQPVPDRVAPSGCGSPSPRPTTLPEPLERRPPIVDEIHVTYGETATTGPFTVEFAAPPRPYYPSVVHVRDANGNDLGSFPTESATRFEVRRGHALLRLDPDADNDVHGRRLKVECAADVALSAVREPTYVWLSTVGHHAVRVADDLEIRLDPDAWFAASNDPERAIFRRRIAPDAVGTSFGVDRVLVEIIDVMSTDATFYEDAWRSSTAVPAVHVQLRLSPI